MSSETEIELKLKGLYNNQLKYSHSSSGSIEKIKSLLDALEIAYGKEEICHQKDEYFDTDNYDLCKKNRSLRLRTVGSDDKQCLTYKEPSSDSQSTEDSLRRNEHNRKDLTCKTDKDKYEAIRIFADENLDKLKMKTTPVVVVNNDRIAIPIKTADNKAYSLCLDKFTFSSPDNHTSDDYYEIEIESENEAGKDITDKKISTLSDLFIDIFSFRQSKESKYERGCRWLKNQNDVKHKLFVALDVVGYSLESPLTQKRIVRELTLILKQILISYTPEEVTRLPVGDGIFLVFDEKLNVISILIQIIQKIRENNTDIPEDKKVFVRSALHYGTVLDCQDVNDNRNVVGDGINITARIINEAKKHQVLVSDDFYNECYARGLVDGNRYGEPFVIRDKHDNAISVRNYYNRQLEIGISI